jgi:LysM repeat protein
LKYNTTVEALASANGISNVTLLRVGQNLRVTGCRREVTPSSPGSQPAAGGYYVVKKDDNLFRIALRYNTSVEDLVSANGLSSNLIYPGQRIYLP